MKASLSVNRGVRPHPKMLAQLGLPTARRKMSLVSPAPEQQPLVRRWHVGATLTAIREVIVQWRRRVLTRNKLTTLSNGDLRDIRRTRAEVEAVRCKAFWCA
jgi:uncharacterized protein YjiS (DUF1127 family)